MSDYQRLDKPGLTRVINGIASKVLKLKAALADIVNVYGTKNLFEINKDAFYTEGGGGTYAFNNDGTISASIDGAGTSTYYILHLSLPLKAGEYIYSSGIEEVGANKYDSALTLNNTVIARGYNGTPNQNFTLNNDATLGWFFRIKNSIGAHSFTIKPMIRLKSIADDTFTPYSMTNQQLTGLYDNEVEMGAVNLLPCLASSVVAGGTTYTVNDDGTISVVAEAPSANSNIYINGIEGTIIPKGRYKIVGLQEFVDGGYNKIQIYVQRKVNGSWIVTFDGGVYWADKGANNVGEEYITLNEDTLIRASLNVYSAGGARNLVVKPMITLASQPNSDYAHYVPYAKSNRELTSDLSIISETVSTDVGTIVVRRLNGILYLTLAQLTAQVGTSWMEVGTTSIPLDHNSSVGHFLTNTGKIIKVSVYANGSIRLVAPEEVASGTYVQDTAILL